MEASVSLKNVSKHFKKRYVLSNLTVGIEKGTTFAIIGRNGAGKSTLLRVLANLLKPDNGNVYINGHDAAVDVKTIKPLIGFLPDGDMHDGWLTGRQNLQRRASYLDIGPERFESAVLPLAKYFEIENLLDEYPVTYPKGIKRRLDLVQVLIGDPEIILLDEPTLGLDYHARGLLYKYLLQLKGDTTVILASNEFTEIQTMADRWIVLHEGRICFDGTLENMAQKLEIPFYGNIEFKQGGYHLIKELQQFKQVREIHDLGKTIQIVTEGIKEFSDVLSRIDADKIISISGTSINIGEFINQLIAAEGL